MPVESFIESAFHFIYCGHYVVLSIYPQDQEKRHLLFSKINSSQGTLDLQSISHTSSTFSGPLGTSFPLLRRYVNSSDTATSLNLLLYSNSWDFFSFSILFQSVLTSLLPSSFLSLCFQRYLSLEIKLEAWHNLHNFNESGKLIRGMFLNKYC